MVDVVANYRKVIDRISEAALRAGRNPREIKLLAAAKSQSVELVQAAIAAGVRLIGENYVQEAESKRQVRSYCQASPRCSARSRSSRRRSAEQ